MSIRTLTFTLFMAVLTVFLSLASLGYGAAGVVPAANVHIEIYDEDGKPVKGADIWVYPSPDSPKPPLTTGEDGSLDITVKAGTSFSVSIFYLTKYYQTIEAFVGKGPKPVSLSLALKKGSTSPKSLQTPREIHNRFTMIQKLTVMATDNPDETPNFVKKYLNKDAPNEVEYLRSEAKTKINDENLKRLIESCGDSTLKGLDQYKPWGRTFPAEKPKN